MAAGSVVTLAAGALFGLALAAPPGPMNAIIAEESVVRGWSAGFVAGLGAMLADVFFLLLALAGAVAVIEGFPTLQAGMVTVGGLLMLYFAVGAAQNADATLTGETETEAGQGFQKAFVLALTNPYQILFWLTVGVRLLDPGQADVLSHAPYVGESLAGLVVVETGSPALLAGLFGGIVVWIVGFPGALAAGNRRVDALAPAVAGVSAVVLAGFGLFFLWDGVATLL